MRNGRLAALFIMTMCATVCHATQYSQAGEITGMFAGAGNVVGVFHSAPVFNPAGCPSAQDSAAYLIDYNSQADWSKVYSMLLSAHVSGTPIRIGIDPTNCYAGHPVIARVAFVQGY